MTIMKGTIQMTMNLISTHRPKCLSRLRAEVKKQCEQGQSEVMCHGAIFSIVSLLQFALIL